MRSSNPALRESAFSNMERSDPANAMTVQGAVNKTSFLLLLLVMSASWSWGKAMQSVQTVFGQDGSSVSSASSIFPLMIGAGIAAFIVAMITIFKKEWAGITSPIYAVLEGVLLGGLSAIFNLQYPGIVIQAVALTFGTLFALLLAYKSGLIRVTEKFRTGIIAATGGIAVFYFLTFILGFFGVQMPLVYSSSPMGIGFSLFVVVIAALNLVLDFDFIERGQACGAPKYMEWYGAFGIMVTLVWLYIEILRLLAKLRSRN